MCLLQCVAVCCSVMQCALQCIAVHYSASQCHHNVPHIIMIVRQECGSVLQCIAVCCSVLQCVLGHYSALQCITVHYSALQCIAVHCIAVQCRIMIASQEWVNSASSYRNYSFFSIDRRSPYPWSSQLLLAAWCLMLQCVAVCCSVLQCVVVWSSQLLLAPWCLIQVQTPCHIYSATHCNALHHVATHCSTLQRMPEVDETCQISIFMYIAYCIVL